MKYPVLCLAFLLCAACEKPTPATPHSRTIVFLGDSLTDGYSLGMQLAYPALLETKLRAAGLSHHVRNEGRSGNTTGDGLARLNEVLNGDLDIFVLALGANDALRQVPIAEIRKNLSAILTETHRRFPDAALVLVGVDFKGPNVPRVYAEDLRLMYSELAREHRAFLLPDLLKDVSGISVLNLGDGIHPNDAGQRRIAENMWAALEGWGLIK